jgi:phosphatidylserine decarboxylase
MPCAGTVRHLQFRAGAFLPAYNPDAPTRNESQDLGLVTADGARIMVRQISGVLARRIVCEAELEQRVERGERYGMIKLGSRTELYVPAGAGYSVEVSVGASVRGGKTVLVRRPRQVNLEQLAERRLAKIVSEGAGE